MNTQKAPFNDVRVRQAFALALNRPSIVQGLWGKYGELGNDSPMWPGYPYTANRSRSATSRSRRRRRCSRPPARRTSRSRSRATGRSRCPTTRSAWRRTSRRSASTARVKVYTSAQYFDGVSFGAAGKLAPWLGTDFGIVDYGGRPVPITYLNAALRKGGVWNAARYSSPKFEKLVAQFYAAPNLASQKKYSAQIQNLLLHDTPAIYAYFYNFIAASLEEGARLRARRHGLDQPPQGDDRLARVEQPGAARAAPGPSTHGAALHAQPPRSRARLDPDPEHDRVRGGAGAPRQSRATGARPGGARPRRSRSSTRSSATTSRCRCATSTG